MRVLVIHEVGYFEKPIFEMHEIPEELALLGDAIGFVQFSESRAELKKSKWRTFSKRSVSGRLEPSVSMDLYDPFGSGGGLVRRVLAAMFSPISIGRIISDFEPDVIFLYAVPTFGLAAVWMGRRKGVPVCFRSIDVSHKIRKSAFGPVVSLFERLVYWLSTSISANNPELVRYVAKKTFGSSQPIWHKPPLNLQMFSGHNNESRRALRAQFGISDETPVIIYMGSFFYFSGLPDVLRCMSQDDSDTLLMLVGGGESEKSLRRAVDGLGLANRVIFTGFVDFSRLPSFLNMGDIAINPMKKKLVSESAFPNKVIQYMASGLPVVSVDLKGMTEVLGMAPGLALASSPTAVWRKALELARDKEIKNLGRLNKKFVSSLFSYHREIQQIRMHLMNLVNANAREGEHPL